MEKNEQDILYNYSLRITGSEAFTQQILDACRSMNLAEAYQKATRLAAELRGDKAQDPHEVQNRLLDWINSPQKLRQLSTYLDELPEQQQAIFAMRHQAEMSMGSIAEYWNSDHCTVVYRVMETEKYLLAKMNLPKDISLPKIGGKPFWKGVLELS